MLNIPRLHTGFHISSFFSMAFGNQSLSSLYSKRSLCYSYLANSVVILERVILLHSWNVQVLLELWHGARSYIKIFTFFGNTTNLHNISIASGILHS